MPKEASSFSTRSVRWRGHFRQNCCEYSRNGRFAGLEVAIQRRWIFVCWQRLIETWKRKSRTVDSAMTCATESMCFVSKSLHFANVARTFQP